MKKNDLILILIILVVAAGFYGYQMLRQNEMDTEQMTVEIFYDGKLQDQVLLLDTKEITIETEIGKNIISIDNGKVSMIDADCPDQICIKSGAIDGVNENIVCLPNKVHIEIVGKREGEVDVIAE